MSKEKGDFVNAFAPVPHLSGIRAVQSIATANGWFAVTYDLDQGFIQADLPDDGNTIYITPPKGYNEEEGVVKYRGATTKSAQAKDLPKTCELLL